MNFSENRNRLFPSFLHNSFFLAALLFCLLTLAACAETTDVSSSAKTAVVTPAAGKKISVAVSIVPEESFVKAVGGALVDTVVLIPPGSSESNYAPAPQELIKLSTADLYFSIGVPTEKANILPKLPGINANIKLVDLAVETAKIYPEREYEPGQNDPHIWLSPKRVKVIVQSIASNLAETDPVHAETYMQNATAFIHKLDELNKTISAGFKQSQRKTFLVYHPAFGYFADEYGLTMLAVENEGKEASIDDLRWVIDMARKEKIKTIFYQAEVDSKQASVIAAELGGKKELLAPLAANYLENLGVMADLIALSLAEG